MFDDDFNPYYKTYALVLKRIVDLATEVGVLNQQGETDYARQLKHVIFDTMRSNAKNEHSLFKDVYFRDGADIDEDALLKETIASHRLKFNDGGQGVVIEIDDVDAFVEITGMKLSSKAGVYASSEELTMINIEQNGKTHYIVIDNDKWASRFELIKKLGSYGLLPSREKLLSQFVNVHFKEADTKQLIAGFLKYFPQANDAPNSENIAPTEVSPQSLIEIKNELLITLISLIEKMPTGINHDAYHFYYRLIKNLVLDLDFDEQAIPSQLLVTFKRTLSRMQNTLNQMEALDYESFLLAVELFVDEISCLKQPLNLNPSDKEKALQQDKLGQRVTAFLESQVGERPQFATFKKSGMHAITSAVVGTLKKFKDKKGLSFGVGDAAYYEITDMLNAYFYSQVEQNGEIISTKHGKLYKTKEPTTQGTQDSDLETAKVESDDKIIDFYIGSFENNVDDERVGYHFKDIESLIEDQFTFRSVSNNPVLSESPLVVIIDNTMSAFDETYFPALLLRFENQIIRGQLAVVMASSLNKHFHMGTDKTPLGIYACYANRDVFPTLTSLSQYELQTGTIAGMSSDSATLSLACTIMKNCSPLINAFRDMASDRVRQLYANTFSQSVKEGMHVVKVDNPISNPRKEAGVATYLCQSWGFINIRINEKNLLGDSSIVNTIEEALEKLIQEADIYSRDGYAFSRTTYIKVTLNQTHFIRVSIGTESLDRLECAFKIINNYLVNLNQYLDPMLSYISYLEKISKQKDELSEPLNKFENIVEKEVKSAKLFRFFPSKDKLYVGRYHYALEEASYGLNQALIEEDRAAENEHLQKKLTDFFKLREARDTQWNIGFKAENELDLVIEKCHKYLGHALSELYCESDAETKESDAPTTSREHSHGF